MELLVGASRASTGLVLAHSLAAAAKSADSITLASHPNESAETKRSTTHLRWPSLWLAQLNGIQFCARWIVVGNLIHAVHRDLRVHGYRIARIVFNEI